MDARCVAGLLRVVLPAGLLVLALAACEGGGGPVSSPRPSPALPTLSASVPTRSAVPEASASRTPRPTPTRSAVAAPPPSPSAPDPTTPTESRPAPPPAPTRTPGTPTQTSTPTPSRTMPSTSAAAPTSTSGSTPQPAPAATPVSSSPSPWVWWLIGLLIVGAGVALVLAVRRQRARKAWSARRAGAVTESTWLAHELVPNALSAQSPAARRDLWTAFRPRVGALHRNLSELVASAPSDEIGRLDPLRDAVTGLGRAMDAYAATDVHDPERLGAARQAQRQLEDALAREVQPPPAPGAP